MGKVVHIIIVGESLISNTGGEGCRKRESDKVLELNDFTSRIDERTYYNEDKVNRITDILLNVNPEEELGFRGNPRIVCQDRLPKEISYLFLRKKQNTTKCNTTKEKVYLISADSNPLKICSEVVKRYIFQRPELNEIYDVSTDIKFISGVSCYNGNEFQQEGIKNLLSAISDIVEKYKDAEKIYLNITDANTAAIPFLVFYAISHKNVVICCLHENSPDIIEFSKV